MDIIQKIKEKATEFARTHATNNAKAFYLLGKRDAAHTFLAMIKSDGIAAILDVANEVLRNEPNQPEAKWILENKDQWKIF